MASCPHGPRIDGGQPLPDPPEVPSLAAGAVTDAYYSDGLTDNLRAVCMCRGTGVRAIASR